jgi:hypothetical protein
MNFKPILQEYVININIIFLGHHLGFQYFFNNQ